MSETIGVFDSGLGGLTVVFNIQHVYPQTQIIYFGDTARLPYGNKSPEAVNLFARQNTRFLLTFKPKVVVVACHTASALALKNLKKEFSTPLLGVLTPAVTAALRQTKKGIIGVIGTIATIKSNAYQKEIHKRNPEIRVHSIACPLFVPLVEEGMLSSPITEMVINHYLMPFKKEKVDTLILACTHYPLLKEALSRFLGPEVILVDPSEEVTRELIPFLKEENGKQKRTESLKIYLSDVTPNFRKVAVSFLRRPIPKIIRQDTGEK
ncbi:MAG: glutamate racemase [bacterium (Candidatus Ratteibacteria) CG23_combo_of_CG06-09_8_20_14_all_48_7]|uniref:Glutamate racemase n=1 Tax=bacterium (Candidatus Ratteibacteria) CG23_combo_of_CG06-09_8_20_14_all_48_7 TaxID=2014292 RepID=A0A2G9YB44_9BACT|nr:MAG: glutamate racemase [bacterium (Candidatus Ratteibacteria) CG23_combo_of_CG06-09_8_20_14_all_48_7]